MDATPPFVVPDSHARAQHARAIGYIPGRDLLAVAYQGTTFVYLYDINSGGEPIATFAQHSKQVVAFTHLFGDFLASIDAMGTIIAWDVTTRVRKDTLLLRTHHRKYLHFTKLSHSKFAVGLCGGRVRIVSHTNGVDVKSCRDINTGQRYIGRHSISAEGGAVVETHESNDLLTDARYAMCALGDGKLAVSMHQVIRIYNYRDGMLLDTLKNRHRVHQCVANDWFLVASFGNRSIQVCINGGDFQVIAESSLSQAVHPDAISLHFAANSLRLIESHLLMITTKIHGVFFFSLPTLELIASIDPPLAGQGVYSSLFLDDNRICVGRHRSCDILAVPQGVQGFIQSIRTQGPLQPENDIVPGPPSASDEVETDLQPISDGDSDASRDSFGMNHPIASSAVASDSHTESSEPVILTPLSQVTSASHSTSSPASTDCEDYRARLETRLLKAKDALRELIMEEERKEELTKGDVQVFEKRKNASKELIAMLEIDISTLPNSAAESGRIPISQALSDCTPPNTRKRSRMPSSPEEGTKLGKYFEANEE